MSRTIDPWIGRTSLRTGVAALIALSTLTARARAGEPPEQAAKALFEQALERMASGDHPSACRMLEQSDRLDPGMGTKFRLAECREQIGELSLARDGFRAVAEAAKSAGQPDRERVARGRQVAVEARMPAIQLVIPSSVAALKGVEILLDGRILSAAQWGEAQLVDVGEHVVEARAEGREPLRRPVWLHHEGDRATAAIAPLKVIPPAPAGGSAARRPGERPVRGGAAAGGGGVWERYQWPILAGGTALALVGVGAGASIKASSRFDTLRASCGGTAGGCSERDKDAVAQDATMGAVMLGAGGVVAAVSIVLTVVAVRSGAAAPVKISVGPGAVGLSGRF